MELGSAIKSIRKEKAISQKELARNCNISATSLVQIEKNSVLPKKSTLHKVSVSLGVPISYILFCAISEKDVSKGNREIFKATMEYLKSMILAELP